MKTTKTSFRILTAGIALLAFASCKKDQSVAVVSKNISTVAKAPIDRFSSLFGHLFVRTATNGLPVANAAINFDAAPFITTGFSPSGAITQYYNFDAQSATPDDIYVFYTTGASSPLAGQFNVIPTIPGDKGYSDFWRISKVTVPVSFVLNSLTSEESIIASGNVITKTTAIVNCPVVPYGSVAAKKFGGGSQVLTLGWYKDHAIAYFNFAEKALVAAADGTLATSPIYVSFNDNIAGPSSGFKMEAGTAQTHNVLSTSPSATGYSPLWQVKVYDNANFSTVKDLPTAINAKLLNPNAALVNCPTVL